MDRKLSLIRKRVERLALLHRFLNVSTGTMGMLLKHYENVARKDFVENIKICSETLDVVLTETMEEVKAMKALLEIMEERTSTKASLNPKCPLENLFRT